MRTLTARICILGSGPAGLGAAYELKKLGENNVVIIDRNHLPGGLARTEVLDGNRFDIGPHRFFTSNKEVNHLWHKTLGNDFGRCNVSLAFITAASSSSTRSTLLKPLQS